MNRSGQAVAALARFYRIEPAEMLVLHDELDLPPGQLRLKFGGGLGGHNGLKDIAAHLGTQDFWRLRIGIGHPGDRNQVVDYVLKKPRSEERADRRGPGPRPASTGRLLARRVQRRHAEDQQRPKGKDQHESQMRHRRPAQRRQVHPVQRADQVGHRGGELSLLHHRAERRHRRGAGPPPGGNSPPSSSRRRSSRPSSSSSTSPAWSPAPARARAWATSSSPTSARPTPSCTWCAASHDDNVVHVSGKVDPLHRHRE
jgi:hypothetical protein